MKRLLLLMIISWNTQAQYFLKPGSQVQISNADGSMAVLTHLENLTCGGPGNSETIQYLTCGNGTTTNPDGTCITEGPGEPFELDYGLNMADSCSGVDGTPEWRGPHPIGTGNGQFSYTLSFGISGPTQFTLSCDPQTRVHQFKRVLHQGSVDLRNLIDSGRVLSDLLSEYRVIDMQTGKGIEQQLNYQVDVEAPMNTRFIIKQHGDQLHVLPVGGNEVITLQPPNSWFDENTATFMYITGDDPMPNTMANTRARGSCESLSLLNDAKIQVASGKEQGGCYVDMTEPSYLVWYLLEQ
jgi:hypothetical protein